MSYKMFTASFAAGSIAEGIYKRHWTELCGYIRRVFGSGPPDPEDVAQTAFARFMQLARPEDIDNPWAFLTTTARHIAIDEHRRMQRSRAHTSDVADLPENNLSVLTPEDVFLQEERFEILAAALEALPLKQRRLVLLNRFEGLSYGEIGRRFGMSGENVRKHVERSLAHCAHALEAAGRPGWKGRRPR